MRRNVISPDLDAHLLDEDGLIGKSVHDVTGEFKFIITGPNDLASMYGNIPSIERRVIKHSPDHFLEVLQFYFESSCLFLGSKDSMLFRMCGTREVSPSLFLRKHAVNDL
jgi:hypothetical protein